jgi:uncharacterized protein (TIRG00374 family)
MWWLLARLVISGGLLAFFFVPHPSPPVIGRVLPRQISLERLASALLQASPGWLLTAAVVTAPVIVLVSWKWQILLRAAGLNERLLRLIRMNLVGGFYSLILPGEETGQLAKGVILARHTRGDAVAASIVVDEILGTLSVFGIALVALALTQPFPLKLPIALALGIMLAGFLCLLAIALSPQVHGLARLVIEWLAGRLRLVRFQAWLEPFWDRLAEYHRRPWPLLAAFLITVAAHLLADVSVLATMNSVSANVPYLDVLWIYAAISALVTIPITVSGFGIREGANVVILGQLGVPPDRALAISLLAFAIGFVWSLPGAALQFGIRSKLPAPPAARGRARKCRQVNEPIAASASRTTRAVPHLASRVKMIVSRSC